MVPSAYLMELFKAARHRREPAQWTSKHEANNRACGDRVTLYLRMEGGLIRDAGFEAEGCSLTLSSAELLCRSVLGLSPAEASQRMAYFYELVDGSAIPSPEAAVSGQPDTSSGNFSQPAELAPYFEAFLPLRELPLRRRCATLAWENLAEAVQAG